MDKLYKEAEKTKAQHVRYMIIIEKLKKELARLDKIVNQQEMNCFMHGSELCLAAYDNLLLVNLETNRKIEKLEMDKRKACWTVIPFSLRPKSEFDWELKPEDGILQEHKKYYECARPFYDKQLLLYQEITDLKRKLIREFQEFKFT